MKMLNNGLEVDGFATSRIPIPSRRSTKVGEGDLPCAARPPERPAQVHHAHHVEDGAVAEHVDGVDAREKAIKNSGLPSTVPVACVAAVDTRWLGNANAPRLDVDHPPNDHGVVKWGVSRRLSLWGLAKPAMGSPKPSESINKSEPRKYPINAGVIIFQANGNPMEGNRLIVPLCENV